MLNYENDLIGFDFENNTQKNGDEIPQKERKIDEWGMCYANTPEEDAIEREMEKQYNQRRKEARAILRAKPQFKSKRSQRNEFLLKTITIAILFSFVFGVVGAYLFNAYLGGVILVPRGEVNLQVVEKTDPPVITDLDPTSIPAVVVNTQDSVVAITTNTVTNNQIMGEYVKEGAGSGVIISEDGYIVTNTHVIKDANSIIVRLNNNTEYSASVIGTDVSSDISVIKIDVTGLKPATFGSSANLIIGQTIVAIGNPLGELGGTVTSGIVSAKDRDLTINGQNMNLLQFSAAVNPGNSGGGLFNLNSELVGIVNAKTSGSDIEGLGFAIPADDVQELVKQLIETGKVSGRPQLGVSLIEVETVADIHKYANEKIYPYLDTVGVYILDTDSPYLMMGDKIVAIDNVSVTTFNDLKKYVDSKKVGDTVKLTISRNKKLETFDIVLTEKQ